MKTLISMTLAFVGLALIAGCGPAEIKPVDIYPEDNCSNCRMAVSERSFASEIIAENGEALKFDDLGCLESYRKKNPALKFKAIFVTDYETKEWIPFEKSIIVQTSLDTPMGSGKIAVKDSARAKALTAKYPPASDVSQAGCSCADEQTGNAAGTHSN